MRRAPWRSFRTHIRTALPVIAGTAIYAFGLHYFIIPNELMEGGITGIAILLKYVADWAPSATTLLMNIPLFILGWKILGRPAMLYTFLGTVSLSFFLWVMERCIDNGWLAPFHADNDFFLATLYAGVTIGTGLGLVFRYGGTTGGSDIIARIGHKLKGWSIGKMILAIDAVVISLSLLYIPQEKVLYTLVAVFIATRLIDFFAEGAYAAKAFTIITEPRFAPRMLDAIAVQLERGATLFQAVGGYSRESKPVIYCVVHRHEMFKLKKLARTIDPAAFIIISDAHQVVGEGFRRD